MSRPNAALAEPREREAEALLQTEPQPSPGQVLELDRLRTMLDDLGMAFADVKLAHTYALFESSAHRFAGLASHFAKSVTNQRPRPPHTSPMKE